MLNIAELGAAADTGRMSRFREVSLIRPPPLLNWVVRRWRVTEVWASKSSDAG